MEDAAEHAEHAGHEGPGALARSSRTLVLAVLAVVVLAVAAFVVLGLVAGPPRATVQRLAVAPWRTTLGDAASAAGFAVTVAGLVLTVRAGQVGGGRRTAAADAVDALDGDQRRRAARAVAGHRSADADGASGHGASDADGVAAARATAQVQAARWTVVVLFAGLLTTGLGRAVVAPEPAALVGPGAAVVVLAVVLAVLVLQGRRARDYLLHHPDRRTPPAVLAALARWTGSPRT